MKYYALLLILLLSILTPIVIGQIDRHTLGFPDKVKLPENITLHTIIISDKSGVNKSLKIYPPSVEVAPESIEDLEKLIKSQKLPLSTRDLNRLRDIGDLSISEIISRIESEELRNLLHKLYKSNTTLTRSELESILSHLKTLKAQGKITPVDEILALRALMDLISSGDKAAAQDLLGYMTLALRELEVEKFISKLVEFTPTQQLSLLNTTISEKPLLPGMRLPQLAPLPSSPHLKLSQLLTLTTFSPQLLVIIASLALIIVGVVLLYREFHLSIPSIITYFVYRTRTLLHRRSLFSDSTALSNDLYLNMYWNSVKAVEILTGVKRNANTTHREYLKQVSDKLREDLLVAFTSITKAYEEYRYANSKRTVQLIIENYEKLVKSIGTKTTHKSN